MRPVIHSISSANQIANWENNAVKMSISCSMVLNIKVYGCRPEIKYKNKYSDYSIISNSSRRYFAFPILSMTNKT